MPTFICRMVTGLLIFSFAERFKLGSSLEPTMPGVEIAYPWPFVDCWVWIVGFSHDGARVPDGTSHLTSLTFVQWRPRRQFGLNPSSSSRFCIYITIALNFLFFCVAYLQYSISVWERKKEASQECCMIVRALQNSRMSPLTGLTVIGASDSRDLAGVVCD
jgi:hypothetical protein